MENKRERSWYWRRRHDEHMGTDLVFVGAPRLFGQRQTVVCSSVMVRLRS
jgi:hypothetical protein